MEQAINPTKIKAIRTHSICAGHRVHGHESKCAHLHGHNYKFEFHCTAGSLDNVWRVIDFSDIKEKLCMWLEENWDHRFLLWEKDPIAADLSDADSMGVVRMPFNPTAENMAKHVLEIVGPEQFAGTGVMLEKVVLHETDKCFVEVSRSV